MVVIKLFGKNSKVKINGKTYIGNNIVVDGNSVIVDGVKQEDSFEGKIEVKVLCNVKKIISDKSININGDIHGNVEAKTNINCNDISGDVKAGTSINCDDIDGDATATTINCDDVSGDITANMINY